MTNIKKLIDILIKNTDIKNKEQIENEKDLLNSGHIDSFGLIQLVLDIETEYKISINTEDLTHEKFYDVKSIEKLIKSYLKKI